jgi:hypothetical protein
MANDKISFTRDFGNSDVGNLKGKYYGQSVELGGDKSHPFVKGYWYLFIRLPGGQNGTFGGYAKAEAEGILSVHRVEFTPHGASQVNTGEIPGMGGLKTMYATGLTHTNNFSIRYEERKETPITNIHQDWMERIVNPYMGAKISVDNDGKSDFNTEAYKGTAVIIQTTPVVKFNAKNDGNAFTKKDIVRMYVYEGVFPTAGVDDLYNSNIEDNNDKPQPSIQYAFDGVPLNNTNTGVLDLGVKLLNGKIKMGPETYIGGGITGHYDGLGEKLI